MKKVIIISIIFSIISCNLSDSTSNKNKSLGSFSITVDTASRYLDSDTPNITNITEYQLIGIGPEGEALNVTSDNPSFESIEIVPGEWIFTVKAFNSSNVLIKQGTISLTILSGEDSSGSIVLEYVGSCYFELDLNWLEELVEPTLTTILYNYDTSIEPITLNATINGDNLSAVISENIPAGLYKLVVAINSGEIRGGYNDFVEIVTGDMSFSIAIPISYDVDLLSGTTYRLGNVIDFNKQNIKIYDDKCSILDVVESNLTLAEVDKPANYFSRIENNIKIIELTLSDTGETYEFNFTTDTSGKYVLKSSSNEELSNGVFNVYLPGTSELEIYLAENPVSIIDFQDGSANPLYVSRIGSNTHSIYANPVDEYSAKPSLPIFSEDEQSYVITDNNLELAATEQRSFKITIPGNNNLVLDYSFETMYTGTVSYSYEDSGDIIDSSTPFSFYLDKTYTDSGEEYYFLFEKEIVSFEFEGITSSFQITDTDISIIVPSETNIVELTPYITYLGNSISPLDGVINDFSNQVIYTVKSQDGSTLEYTINVINKPTLELTITNNLETSISYSFSETLNSLSLVDGDVIDITPIIPMGQTIGTYSWYIDGVDIEVDTSSFSLDHSNFNIGGHSISCIITVENELFTLPLDFIIE